MSRSILDSVRRAWARVRAWRRIRFTGAGVVFTVGAVAVGLAAVNTGNNLLYLLLGAMLGVVVLSGWLSEQTIRALDVTRRVPAGTPVGKEARIRYVVHNRKRHLPSMALEIGEEALPARAFLARIPAGERREGVAANRFVRRGVYPLSSVTLSTTYPFGLFLKARDIDVRGELVIWPRTDRRVRIPTPAGAKRRDFGGSAGAAGHRGEYRQLREYRPGDDPRDIHWRRSAGLDVPVIREYELDGAESFWLCLDLGAPAGDEAEAVLEIAASVAARAVTEGTRFGLISGDRTVPVGTGPGHLEAVLDALARADFHPTHPMPDPPVDRARCVLVSVTGRGRHAFGDALVGAPDDTSLGPGRAAPFREAS